MDRPSATDSKASIGGDSGVSLADMSPQDLDALRLAAQVMAHRAALADLPRVALYFERIEAETLAEQAASAQLGRRMAGPAPGVISIIGDRAATSDGDRAVIGEYLDLLVANGGLPKSVRDWLGGLRGSEPLSSGQ